ncbi:MAG: DegT/DnrJ/EryC1/StrS family aminotransferase [Spirochaetota bacterium]
MHNPIPFFDLKRQQASLADEIEPAFRAVCEQTAFAGGPFVEAFEKAFAQYCGTRFCAGLNSGTVALHFAMNALGIGPGDEVIVPANTFIATAWGVTHSGATPVFVDCDADTWTIDPAGIQAKVTKKTKAIIGVHLYGQPCDVDAIAEIAEKNELFFVEDCAQAHGATFRGKRVGGFGAMGCFSFYPGKNLGAYGEAGAVTADNPAYVEHIAMMRNQGSKVRYYHEVIGYNERMDGVQAAILGVKLKHLDGWNKRRRAIAGMYRKGITNKKIRMQREPSDRESVYHLFVIMVDGHEALLRHLNTHNIFPGQHYPVPCHLQKAYRHLGHTSGDLPNAERLAASCLSLPMYPELTDEEVSRVIDTVNTF